MINEIFAHQKLKSELRPSNVVRFYEKALKAQKSIVNMEKDHLDPIKQLEFEFLEKSYQIKMLFHVALDYANEKQFAEAYQVLLKLQADIENALEFSAKNSLKTKKVSLANSEINAVLKTSRGVISKVVSRLLL